MPSTDDPSTEERLLARIRQHVHSYGLHESEHATLADIIEKAFVSHCAARICSLANEPGSHWCRRHKNLLTDQQARIRQLEEALREGDRRLVEYIEAFGAFQNQCEYGDPEAPVRNRYHRARDNMMRFVDVARAALNPDPPNPGQQ